MSGAMTLLVDRRGAELELKRNDVICLSYPDGQQHRVGLYALRRIVIQGGEINLSGSLLRACETAGVSIVLLPGRYKGNSVNLFPHVVGNIKLRLGQYRAFFDDDIRLSLARQAVATKIEAQSSWLNHHDLTHDFSPFIAQLQRVHDNASLMGIEGSIAQQYFAKWRILWDDMWGFKERNRRPPRDPVNALLSLGYTLAGNSLGQMVSTYGLDVSLGFLHAPLSNRPSLMLDVLEPVRPWIDQWLWLKVHSGLLTPKHFSQSNEYGCRLNQEGRGLFFSAWYDEAESFLRAPMRESLALLLKTLHKYRYPIE